MADDVIPDDIRLFILHHIGSIAQLEALLIFCADPFKKWNAKTIGRLLYVDELQAKLLLVHLQEQGFLSVTETDAVLHYQYEPKSPELGVMVKRTGDLYRRCLVPVTNLIHSKSKNKIREFANAFRIRKD